MSWKDVLVFAAGLGHAADVIVAGQPISEDATRLDDALIEGALMGAGRPCLMLPRLEAPRARSSVQVRSPCCSRIEEPCP